MVNSNCRGSYPVNRIEGAVCVCLVGTVQYVVRDTMVSSNCRDRYQNRIQYVVRDTMVNSNCRGSYPVNRIEGAVCVCLVGTVQYVVRDTMVNSNRRGSYACIEGADDISCVPVNRDLQVAVMRLHSKMSVLMFVVQDLLVVYLYRNACMCMYNVHTCIYMYIICMSWPWSDMC